MFSIFTKKSSSIFKEAKSCLDLTDQMSKQDQKNIERLFARLFSTEDGRNVLAYLHYSVFQRAFGSNVTDEQLRFSEGQRAMIANISRLIERGRQG
ncbi:MAG TPA: hypothetical protein PLF01_03725 [Alphaproteobacteria bacterium]|nr:hypothetical protein [Alphaproteobacteria bacterium]